MLELKWFSTNPHEKWCRISSINSITIYNLDLPQSQPQDATARHGGLQGGHKNRHGLTLFLFQAMNAGVVNEKNSMFLTIGLGEATL